MNLRVVPTPSGQEPYQALANNEAFRTACQRYAMGAGSRFAIAEAALAAIGYQGLVRALQEAEKFSRAAISHGDNAALQANSHNCAIYMARLREALAGAGAEPLP
jgi:hypothetical protein